ncbi:hypothetical protein Tco_1382310, partial [Tanacetum coccineum]
LASKSRSIGYQLGSPVQGALVRNFNFEGTTLKPYDSLPEKYADALTRGSKNGGVDAIVDEIPYIKEFLAQYPSGYSMTVSETIANGFGFVSLFTILFFNISVNMGKRSKQVNLLNGAFPKGSTLAPEMSIQIAKLREDGALKLLEDKWFNKQLDSATGPKILNFEGFRGLFLISGVSMASALFLYMLYSVHEKVHFMYTMLAGGKLAFIMRDCIPDEYSPATIPQRHVAGDRFPQRHIAGENPEMSLGKTPIVVVLNRTKHPYHDKLP